MPRATEVTQPSPFDDFEERAMSEFMEWLYEQEVNHEAHNPTLPAVELP